MMEINFNFYWLASTYSNVTTVKTVGGCRFSRPIEAMLEKSTTSWRWAGSWNKYSIISWLWFGINRFKNFYQINNLMDFTCQVTLQNITTYMCKERFYLHERWKVFVSGSVWIWLCRLKIIANNFTVAEFLSTF